MDEDKCNQWVEEAEKQSEWSPKDAAELFKEAAECYDREGKRQQAAVYFTLAGQFFLDLNVMKKAGELFGKAIIRNIIADDIEAAEILLKKAEEYNFDSFQFRLARDRFSKKFKALEEEELRAKIEELASADERLMQVVDLESYGEFDEISSIEQLSEDSVLRSMMEQSSTDDILPSVSEFVFKEDPSKRIAMEDASGDRIMESVLKRSRAASFDPIESSVIARTESGSSRVLKSRSRIRPSVDLADLGVLAPATDLEGLQFEAIDSQVIESGQDLLKIRTSAKSVSPEESDLTRSDLETPYGKPDARARIPAPDLDLETTPAVPDLEEVILETKSDRRLITPLPPDPFIPTEHEIAGKLDMDSLPSATLPDLDGSINPSELPEFGKLKNLLATIIPTDEEPALKTETVPPEITIGEPEQQEVIFPPLAPSAPVFEKPAFNLDGVPVLDLDTVITMKSEFITESNVINEYDQDLEDVEIMDTVPFGWQIKEIKHGGFELVSRKAQADQGVVFTWKKKRLVKGETAKIEYVVVKRIQRSIVTKQENKFSLVNTYHSLSDLDTDAVTAKIEFVNTTGKTIDHLLIEDLIPPEFTVRKIDSGDRRSIKLPTKDSVIYRWIIEDMAPGDSLIAEYTLVEKQLVRWYRRRFTHWAGSDLAVEKIVQPVTDIEDNEYLIYLDIKTDFDNSLQIMDQVPPGSNVVFYHPAWLRPEILSRGDSQFLGWQMQLETVEHVQILLRLKTDRPFNPREPIVKVEGLKSQEERERTIKRISERINLKDKAEIRY